MAVQVVQALHLPVLPEEGDEVVQADEALTAHHLPDHVVGEVALVGGHRAGVGVGGGKGLLGHLQQIGEAGVVQVRDVRQDVILLQLGDQLFAEVGQAVLADMTGADLVLTVPGEGDGLNPVLRQQADPVQISGQSGAVLHAEEGGGPVGLEGLLHISAGAAALHPVGELVHLADEVVPVGLVIADGVLAPAFIGDENGIKLGPVDPLRHGGQGQHPLRVVQRVRIPRRRGPAVCQRVTVQIDQCVRFHSYHSCLPNLWWDEAGWLSRQGRRRAGEDRPSGCAPRTRWSPGDGT